MVRYARLIRQCCTQANWQVGDVSLVTSEKRLLASLFFFAIGVKLNDIN